MKFFNEIKLYFLISFSIKLRKGLRLFNKDHRLSCLNMPEIYVSLTDTRMPRLNVFDCANKKLCSILTSRRGQSYSN